MTSYWVKCFHYLAKVRKFSIIIIFRILIKLTLQLKTLRHREMS